MNTTSLSRTEACSGMHVAIIMDGNGRWAQARGLPRVAGHRRGAIAVRRTVEAALKHGVRTLTLYAFSADNWRRPAAEVSTLMRLFRDYLRKRTDECIEHGIRIAVIGRRDRLSAEVCRAIEAAEDATRDCGKLLLRIAVDYSSRDAILGAAARLNGRGAGRDEFARVLAEAMHAPGPAPDVDLLVRTSGEQRLSDFLLWECAYAELHFTRRLWPDFGEQDLASALEEFASRERRFGAVPQAKAG
ncbi:MAG TPA: di-trans,poly-cis-decaprenylcistransferase [Bryobacteraceae bacterium]|nr:di-trans,poly-cis-decaprenylcistransferase [Bryobacteraceae bacterium]